MDFREVDLGKENGCVSVKRLKQGCVASQEEVAFCAGKPQTMERAKGGVKQGQDSGSR